MEPSHPLIRQMENTLSQRIGSQGGYRSGSNGKLFNSSRIESLLQESAQAIASLSGYIALVTLPQVESATIQHLQLVQVSDRQILLVVVLDVYNNHSILLPAACSRVRRVGLDCQGFGRYRQRIANALQFFEPPAQRPNIARCGAGLV